MEEKRGKKRKSGMFGYFVETKGKRRVKMGLDFIIFFYFRKIVIFCQNLFFR